MSEQPMQQAVVSEAEAGTRADVFLSEHFGVTRTAAARS